MTQKNLLITIIGLVTAGPNVTSILSLLLPHIFLLWCNRYLLTQPRSHYVIIQRVLFIITTKTVVNKNILMEISDYRQRNRASGMLAGGRERAVLRSRFSKS